MTEITRDKRICAECGWKGYKKDLLVADHPFQEDRKIYGCPECLDVETMNQACDEPECWEIASNGTPTTGVYRVTCGDHVPRNGNE